MAELEKETMQDEQKKSRKMSAAQRKKFKYGAIATAITCVVIAIVVVINVLTTMLVEKYPVKLDLTPDGKYEISQDTINYVENLQQEVNFTVLMDESNFQTNGVYMQMVQEILERYTQYSGKIHLSYVDPTKNPDVVNRYQENYSGTLTEGDIVITNKTDETKMRVVNINNMFALDQEMMQYYYYGYVSYADCITGFKGEQDLTSALMYVTDANPITVGVLVYADKANNVPLFNADYHLDSVSSLIENLTKNGYEVKELDLYADAMDPEAYQMLVLPAPINDLSSDMIDKLSAFLYNDGKYERDLIYIADYTQSATPNLDEFLATWGIQMNKEIVFESDESKQQQVAIYLPARNGAVAEPAPVAGIVDEKFSAGMSNTSLPIAAPYCRSMNVLWESKTSGITATLLRTSATSYLVDPANFSGSDTNPDGEQTVMAMSSRRLETGDGESNIMVLGGMCLLDYAIMQETAYNNAEFFVNAVNVMTGKNSSLIIAQKNFASKSISITAGQLNILQYVVYAIPALVVAIGVVVFVRRKNR